MPCSQRLSTCYSFASVFWLLSWNLAVIFPTIGGETKHHRYFDMFLMAQLVPEFERKIHFGKPASLWKVQTMEKPPVKVFQNQFIDNVLVMNSRWNHGSSETFHEVFQYVLPGELPDNWIAGLRGNARNKQQNARCIPFVDSVLDTQSK